MAGCTGADGSPSAGTGAAIAVVSATAQTRIVHELPPGGSSTASIRTLPNAVCKLRPAGVPADSQKQLRLFSDDDGIVRVHMQHVDRSVLSGDLLLDCVDDAGTRLEHTIAVSIRDDAASQAPAHYSSFGKPLLPILDVDPMSLSAEEIHARHYPPRPNPITNQAEYSRWLDLVNSAPTMVAPHLIDDVESVHGPAHSNQPGTSNNWSGYVITTAKSASKFAWIYGEWRVPRAYAESGFASWDHSTMWVGIDGWGSADVVQDGTDQDTLTGFWIQTSSYDAWTEWYPINSQTVSNFPVNPGDDIRAWTWVLDSGGHYSNSPTVGWYYLWNATENCAVELSTNEPSGTVFDGHAAEWVMERPTVLGSIASLAQYASPTSLTGALAYDLNGATHYYTSDTSWQVTMVDNSNHNAVLSTVKPLSSSTMAFSWVNHE